MNPRIITTALIVSVSFGCATHDGIYSPGCIAYAGSTISLSEGQFTWEKYTDEVTVDDGGAVINPFPGYPLSGSYRIERQIVYMELDTGEVMDNMYLSEHGGSYYLLTSKQRDMAEETGNFDKCALTPGGMSDN